MITVPMRRPTIGVFDSGFGGLTVLKALLELIPVADYLYFGDTARLPYGSKSAQTVAKYAVEATQVPRTAGGGHAGDRLQHRATALAIDQDSRPIKRRSVIGVVDPGAERASLVSKNRKVAVIGTEATIGSHAYLRALELRGLEAREKACPLLVPLVEEGWVDHPVTEQVARIYLGEVFTDGFADADVLLLGCTHYPLLKPVLRRVAPQHAAIVDSAESTAQVVAEQLRLAPASVSPPRSSVLDLHPVSASSRPTRRRNFAVWGRGFWVVRLKMCSTST